MELLSPAGNAQKLEYAYAYGADAAYIGLKNFSLRAKADNFCAQDFKTVQKIKSRFAGKKLYCALNIIFHKKDLEDFKNNLDFFKAFPIDAFIVQDLGVVEFLQKEFPNARLHLSTQASCVNAQAAKIYQKIGFSRIVLGRECELSEIRAIKDLVPEMELECFVHGAMCIAYSGRCLLSAYLTGRSAQSGFCSHTCRWNFSANVKTKNDFAFSSQQAKEIAQSGEIFLEEEKRRNEFFPIFEGENWTAILSSKDLEMISHLEKMKNAGVDAIKIEGRMKSVYYVAMTSRAYRAALDSIEEKIPKSHAKPFIESLEEVSHRETTTGFYFNRENANQTVCGATDSPYILAASVKKKLNENEASAIFKKSYENELQKKIEFEKMHPQKKLALKNEIEKMQFVKENSAWQFYECLPLNKIESNSELEFVAPKILCQKISQNDFLFVDPQNAKILSWVNPDHECLLYTNAKIPAYALLRLKDDGYQKGKIRARKR